MNEQNRKEAVKANDFLSQQVIRFTDNALKAIDYKVMREILTNSNVLQFFTRDKNDVYANIQAVKVMDDLKFNFPMIDSIYFIRLKDQYVLGDAPREIAESPELDFIEPYKEGIKTAKWTGERDYKAYTSGTAKKVISLVRSAPYFSEHKQGFFVVNVSLASLQGSINQMYNSETSFVRLNDDKGHHVLGPDSSNTGKNTIFSTYTSPYTGWQVESGMINQKTLTFTLFLYNIWTVLALISVLLGVIWFVHVTKRNYRPVEQIVSLIQTNSQKNQSGGKPEESEFGFIQHTLEHLMEETDQFRKQHQESLIIHKKYLFQEVMEGNAAIKETEWKAELLKYDLDVEGKTAFIQMFEMDSYLDFTKFYSTHDQTLLKFTLYIVIHETTVNHGASVWAEWTEDNRISSIIWEPDDVEPGTIRDSIIQTVRQWVEQYLSFTVTIGGSEPACSLEEIRQCYEKVGTLLQYKAVLGTNRIIHAEHIVRSTQSEISQYFYAIYSISQSLRLSGDDWIHHLTLLFSQIRDSLSSRKEIESLIQFLQQHLERAFSELSKEYRQIWKTTNAELLALGLVWETVEELESSCTRIFETMCVQMNAIKDADSSRSVITEIRSYIIENYTNPDLSLDYLSEKFQMNAKNVSKMFKEEFGENFVDFLIGMRMDYAKKLLAGTHKSMQEISLEVGYFNYNSFNRAFKNIVGLSPRDYRKQGAALA
ncbi:helix-turn-helix domain-containing protein [Paenibacillus baekrokdamisoli]|uniref:helix-turn-helix domain-containing protein n=1 Tax=Paenibacillus baekrokdamisoli TaxID=1712516 RepID=UPI001C858CBC|nr:AraC family transcriptional regulator [Paenibacillus baekrokdamisoli]